jgi:hypothetical protein
MTDNEVRLIMKSHRCDEESARQILADIESGARKVISADDLCRKAGVSRSDLRKSTRPIARLFGESLERLDSPPRNAGRKDNGRRPAVGDRTARGELGAD